MKRLIYEENVIQTAKEKRRQRGDRKKQSSTRFRLIEEEKVRETPRDIERESEIDKSFDYNI